VSSHEQHYTKTVYIFYVNNIVLLLNFFLTVDIYDRVLRRVFGPKRDEVAGA
jgi:hypothetical protein